MSRAFSLKSGDELETERLRKRTDRMLIVLGVILIILGLTLLALGGKM